MVEALDSIVVEVGDLAAATRDLAQLLGREPSPPPAVDAAAAGSARAMFTLANVRLELRGLRAGGLAVGARAVGAPPARASASTLREADPPRPVEASRRAGEGIAALRLRLARGAGAPFPVGPLASPTVPIELVAATPLESPLEAGALGSQACVLGLDHVVIASADPERTRRFLADDLGIRLALDRCFPERGLRLMFFRLGGVTLELASSLDGSPRAPASTPAALPPAGPDAFHGLAWRVASLEAIHTRLLAAGFSLSPIRPGHKPGTRVCTVRAPVHGVPTLLIEHPVPPAADALGSGGRAC